MGAQNAQPPKSAVSDPGSGASVSEIELYEVVATETAVQAAGHADSCDSSDGSCTCGAGYTGAACDSCVEGFIGYPDCADDACDPDPCNGHSDSCDSSDGSCTCSAGYTGAACDSCDEGFIGYPSCVEDPRYKQRFCDGMYLYRSSDLAETPSPVRPRPTPSRHRRLRTSLPPRA